MSGKDVSFAKILRQQRAQQITPDPESTDYFVVDTDGFVMTQDDTEVLSDLMAKFISNQGVEARVQHKGEITTTYINGVLS